jgi:hypothetical protein
VSLHETAAGLMLIANRCCIHYQAIDNECVPLQHANWRFHVLNTWLLKFNKCQTSRTVVEERTIIGKQDRSLHILLCLAYKGKCWQCFREIPKPAWRPGRIQSWPIPKARSKVILVVENYKAWITGRLSLARRAHRILWGMSQTYRKKETVPDGVISLPLVTKFQNEPINTVIPESGSTVIPRLTSDPADEFFG